MTATEARESRSAKASGWYSRTPEQVAADLGVDPASGLSAGLAPVRPDVQADGHVQLGHRHGRAAGGRCFVKGAAPAVMARAATALSGGTSIPWDAELNEQHQAHMERMEGEGRRGMASATRDLVARRRPAASG